MEITQVIVAYRNPLEMWLWESGAIYIWLAAVAILAIPVFYRIWKKMR